MLKKIMNVFRILQVFRFSMLVGSLFCCAFLANARADDNTLNNKPINKPIKLLVWGDSLSAAYGIPVEKGWVQLLQNKFVDKIEVSNASISGETTQGGLSRLPSALRLHKPDIMLLELGANDGLRGISLKVMQRNLDEMITMAKTQGTIVALLGIKLPPNYGSNYIKKFEQVFSNMVAKHKLEFVPFILKDIASNDELMQQDGLHPNEKAQTVLLGNIFPVVEAVFLKEKYQRNK